MRKNKLLSITKSLLAVAVASVMAFSVPVTAEASTVGIDVSKYQGAINWGAVASSGVTFSFVKAGSVNKGLDPYFAQNMAGASAAGVRTGVYIYSYATSVAAAQAEAQLLVKWIENTPVSYPVAFDIEDACQKGLDANTVTAMCNAFGDVVSAAGYTPIIYTYTNFYKSHMTSALKYPTWIAQYADACAIPGYTIWQNSSHGSVPGIAGRVDTDIDVVDWRNYIVAAGPCKIGNNIFVFNNFRKQFGWSNVGGTYYLTDPATGIAKVNSWYTEPANGQIYYLNQTGAALVGINTIGDGIYFFNEDATLHKGWKELSGNTFLFSPQDGKLWTGWYKDTTGTYYLDKQDGHRTSGPANIDNSIYYFDAEGKMQTGLITISDAKFFFGQDGKMQTGFQKIGSGVYYFGDKGMVTGATVIDKDTYYFNSDGIMQTGLVSINGKKFYFAADGKMQKGFVSIGNSAYYFGADGAMMTGIFQDATGTFYAAADDGHVLLNQAVTAGNNTFVFGADGKLVKNQVYSIGKMAYACDANGLVTATAAK